MQIGTRCGDHARLEWVLPYLLNYAAPDKAAPQPGGAPATADDTVPRAVVLSFLPQIIAHLSGLPRAERSLFHAYAVPMLDALPDRSASAVRAHAAQSLVGVAAAAAVLQEAAIQAALAAGATSSDVGV